MIHFIKKYMDGPVNKKFIAFIVGMGLLIALAFLYIVGKIDPNQKILGFNNPIAQTYVVQSSTTTNFVGPVKVNGKLVCLEDGTNCTAVGGASDWTLDGTTVRLTTTTNNVAVGLTTASTKLDVSGVVSSTGIYVNGSGTSTSNLYANRLIATGNGAFDTAAIGWNTEGLAKGISGEFALIAGGGYAMNISQGGTVSYTNFQPAYNGTLSLGHPSYYWGQGYVREMNSVTTTISAALGVGVSGVTSDSPLFVSNSSTDLGQIGIINLDPRGIASLETRSYDGMGGVALFGSTGPMDGGMGLPTSTAVVANVKSDGNGIGFISGSAGLLGSFGQSGGFEVFGPATATSIYSPIGLLTNVTSTNIASSVVSSTSVIVSSSPSNPTDAVNLSYLQTYVAANAGSSATGTAGADIYRGRAVFMSSTSSVFQANTNVATSTFQFVGFAASQASSTQTVNITKPGDINCNFSGLAPGRPYYLNGTAGQIGLSPGTYFARVGIAMNANCLLVTIPQYRAAGTITVSGASNGGTNTVITGFYPAKLRFRTAGVGSTYPQTASWGTRDSSLNVFDSAASSWSTNETYPVYNLNNGVASWGGTLSYGDISFTVTHVLIAGSGTISASILWEAESL